jgi:hypothetical protein
MPRNRRLSATVSSLTYPSAVDEDAVEVLGDDVDRIALWRGATATGILATPTGAYERAGPLRRRFLG